MKFNFRFAKYNSVKIYGKHQDNIVSNYVSIFGLLQQLSHCSLEYNYNLHPMPAPHFTLGGMIYNRNFKKLPTFMFLFSPLYLLWVINDGKKIQYSMLANPKENAVLIHKFD